MTNNKSCLDRVGELPSGMGLLKCLFRMIRRLAILLLMGGGLLFFLQREGQRGAFDAWERSVLEALWHLMAPPTDGQAASADEISDVVLAEVKRGDLPFETWPPAPLDYALIFESLVRGEPAAVAVTMPLAWPSVERLDAATLKERVTLLPRGVLACTLVHGEEVAPLQPESPEAPLPLAQLTQVEGDPSRVPEWGALGQVALPDVRGSKALGFTRIEFGAQPEAEASSVTLPLLARRGEEIVANLLLQSLLTWKGVSASDVRVILGKEIVITPELRVPIDETGGLSVFTAHPPVVRRVSAGALWEADADAEIPVTSESRAVSIKQAFVVVAVEGEQALQLTTSRGQVWEEGELTARALAAVLSGRHFREVPMVYQAALWGALLLGGTGLLLAPRRWQALWWPGGALVLVLTVVLLFVQSFPHWWLPPVIPGVLWLTCGVMALLLAPSRAAAVTPVISEASPAPDASAVDSEKNIEPDFVPTPAEAPSPSDNAMAPSKESTAAESATKDSSAVASSSAITDSESEEVDELARQCLEVEVREPNEAESAANSPAAPEEPLDSTEETKPEAEADSSTTAETDSPETAAEVETLSDSPDTTTSPTSNLA